MRRAIPGLSGVLGAAVIVAALTGCAADPIPTATPSSTVTPVFASDAEALAAAKEAYAAYLKVADEILADGGNRSQRLNDVATSDALKDELEGFSLARERGWRMVGSWAIKGAQLPALRSSGG